MDFFPDLDTLSLWLAHYGSITLFILLSLGIVALPVPEETLMVVAGILMRHGTLNIPGTVVAACLGSICGISVSYLLGKTAGNFLIHKYGKWFGITPQRLEKAHGWFERFGKWTLPIGYFIPGIRHFTGFSAGTTRLDFKQFALFAYLGAAIWVSTFLSIGYFFGKFWMSMYKKLEINTDVLGVVVIVLAVLVILYFLYRLRKRK